MKKDKRKLKKKAWQLMSAYIREEIGRCQCCGGFGILHVHHIIPRARGNSVYFLRENLIVLCAGCHYQWHTTWSLSECIKVAKEIIGEEAYRNIESRKHVMVKISVDELEEMIEKYKR